MHKRVRRRAIRLSEPESLASLAPLSLSLDVAQCACTGLEDAAPRRRRARLWRRRTRSRSSCCSASSSACSCFCTSSRSRSTRSTRTGTRSRTHASATRTSAQRTPRRARQTPPRGMGLARQQVDKAHLLPQHQTQHVRMGHPDAAGTGTRSRADSNGDSSAG